MLKSLITEGVGPSPRFEMEPAETTLKVLNDDELVRSRRKLPEAAVLAPDFFPLLADAMRRAGVTEQVATGDKLPLHR